ncbi:unnamed protein product [Calypogeia fissa]
MQRMGRERHRVFVKSGVTADTTEDLLQRHFSTFGTVTDVYIPRSMPGRTPKGFAYVSFETDDAVQQAVKEAVHEIEGKHYPVGRAEPRPAERSTWHNQERSTVPVAEPLLPWPPRYSRSISPPRGGLLPGPHNGGPVRLEMRSSFAHSPRLPIDAALRDGQPYGPRPVALPVTDLFALDGRMGVSGRMPLDNILPRDQVSRSPRVFVGGLPDALVERHIRAHFQKFGTVEDVYFPRERHTGKRRGFCFVRFDSSRAAHFAASQSPRLIMGYEVGEIKVANERSDDFGNEEPIDVKLDVDGLGHGPERGYGLDRGSLPERSYALERGLGAEGSYGPLERGYVPELGYGPERLSGYKLAPPPYYDLGRDLPRDLPRELPRELPGQLPREVFRDFRRDLPRSFDSSLPIRYRPY